MLETVLSYQSLLENIEGYISDSHYKKDYFIKELDISRATFYNKLKNKSFTVDEMFKLGTLLFPDELKAIEIKEALKQSRKDSREGRTISHENVMAKARKKILG